MPHHHLTNFEIQKYYKNESKVDGVYSRNNLSKIKDGKYITNPDECESRESHQIALYVNAENVTYFDGFGVKHIPQNLENSLEIKNIKASIYKIQAYDSIMREYFCIGFIDFTLKGKSLLE